jgi:hypothetical protein
MDAQPRAGVRACVRARVRAQDADSGVLIWERRFGDVRVLVCASTHVRTHAMRVRGAGLRLGLGGGWGFKASATLVPPMRCASSSNSH